jgi:hypothetical protein
VGTPQAPNRGLYHIHQGCAGSAACEGTTAWSIIAPTNKMIYYPDTALHTDMASDCIPASCCSPNGPQFCCSEGTASPGYYYDGCTTNCLCNGGTVQALSSEGVFLHDWVSNLMETNCLGSTCVWNNIYDHGP